MAFLLKNFFLHVVTVLHQALNLSEKLIGRMYLFQLYLCSLCEFWPESTLYPTGFFFFLVQAGKVVHALFLCLHRKKKISNF